MFRKKIIIGILSTEVEMTDVRNYGYWADLCREWGIYLMHIHLHDWDSRKKTFSQHRHFNGTEWQIRKKALKPNFIFDKTNTIERADILLDLQALIMSGIQIFNPLPLRTMFFDKVNDLIHWSKYMPKSYISFDKKMSEEIIDAYFIDRGENPQHLCWVDRNCNAAT